MSERTTETISRRGTPNATATAPLRAWVQKVEILWRKNLALYVKKGPVIIFGLLFPFFMMLSWIIGRDLLPAQLFTGMTAMTSFFTATAISPVVFPIETREKTLEHQVATPLSLNHILAGIILASVTYSFGITSIVALLMLLGFQISLSSAAAGVGLFVGLLLMAFVGSSIGVLLSAFPTDMTSNVMLLSNFVKFPLLFISGIFIPLATLSTGGLILALCSPLTYLTDALHNCVGTGAGGLLPLWGDLLILSGWVVGLYGVTYYAHSKTLEKRFSMSGGMRGTGMAGGMRGKGPMGPEKTNQSS